MKKPDKIMVHGAFKSVGANHIHELRSSGHRILAIDILSPDPCKYTRAFNLKCQQIERLFKKILFEYVYFTLSGLLSEVSFFICPFLVFNMKNSNGDTQ
jgi:hypothetical protein